MMLWMPQLFFFHRFGGAMMVKTLISEKLALAPKNISIYSHSISTSRLTVCMLRMPKITNPITWEIIIAWDESRADDSTIRADPIRVSLCSPSCTYPVWINLAQAIMACDFYRDTVDPQSGEFPDDNAKVFSRLKLIRKIMIWKVSLSDEIVFWQISSHNFPSESRFMHAWETRKSSFSNGRNRSADNNVGRLAGWQLFSDSCWKISFSIVIESSRATHLVGYALHSFTIRAEW